MRPFTATLYAFLLVTNTAFANDINKSVVSSPEDRQQVQQQDRPDNSVQRQRLAQRGQPQLKEGGVQGKLHDMLRQLRPLMGLDGIGSSSLMTLPGAGQLELGRVFSTLRMRRNGSESVSEGPRRHGDKMKRSLGGANRQHQQGTRLDSTSGSRENTSGYPASGRGASAEVEMR